MLGDFFQAYKNKQTFLSNISKTYQPKTCGTSLKWRFYEKNNYIYLTYTPFVHPYSMNTQNRRGGRWFRLLVHKVRAAWRKACPCTLPYSDSFIDTAKRNQLMRACYEINIHLCFLYSKNIETRQYFQIPSEVARVKLLKTVIYYLIPVISFILVYRVPVYGQNKQHGLACFNWNGWVQYNELWTLSWKRFRLTDVKLFLEQN